MSNTKFKKDKEIIADYESQVKGKLVLHFAYFDFSPIMGLI